MYWLVLKVFINVLFSRKTFYGEDACKALENILPGHVAMLDEYSELQFELKTICKLPDDGIWERFRIAKKPVRSSGHGWATQLGAPYTQALNKYMSLVLSGKFLNSTFTLKKRSRPTTVS